jgi:fumarylacetoacetase
MLNETHDPSLKSWVESANDPATDFPIQNLPFCTFRHKHGGPRVGVAIGDCILDVPEYPSLNMLMESGGSSDLRLRLSRTLRADNKYPPRDLLYPMSECELLVPCSIGDYTDFYASVFHATNVGKMFRPDNPLLPNYKYVPIGYHGRASSVVVSSVEVKRPHGQIQTGDGPPVFGASRQMDYECELGCFVGRGNTLGTTIPIGEAEKHLFGICLVNDWSARDIQRWEYQPLGPFLGKSFSTQVSPFVVTFDALEPFRCAPYERPAGDPAPLEYLSSPNDRGIALMLEVWFRTSKMTEPVRLSRARFDQMYWTLAQMLTHHASNGCNMRAGDLIASGTVSGPGKDERGSLLELTWRGTEPLLLPTGESRKFLEDGDEVILRGYAEREGFRRIGLGECRGKLVG